MSFVDTPSLQWYLIVSFGLVLVLAAVRYGLPKLQALARGKTPHQPSEVAVLYQKPLDVKHRVVVVGWRQREYCLLLGPTTPQILDTWKEDHA